MRGNPEKVARLRAKIAAEHASEGEAARCEQDYRVQEHSPNSNSLRVTIPQIAQRNFGIGPGTVLRPFVDFESGAIVFMRVDDVEETAGSADVGSDEPAAVATDGGLE